jgi:hypothetical protein
MQVTQTVFINLSTEEIFLFLSNLDNLAAWSSATSVMANSENPVGTRVGTNGGTSFNSSSSSSTPAPISASEIRRVGVTLQSTIRFLGMTRDMMFEVVEYDPYRFLTIKSISGVAPCYFCYQFDPVADGGTSVSLEFGIDFTENLGEEIRQIAISALHRQIEYDLLTLKDILEIRALLSQRSG